MTKLTFSATFFLRRCNMLVPLYYMYGFGTYLSVCVVSAWDADDDGEGVNARISYSIEENAFHETTGEPIFSLEPQSGLVSTAVCCLDRETTPEYFLRVLATDGGGLQGTGTVVVRLTDVNDNAPRLTQRLWQVDVNETWGAGPPDGSSLLEITAADLDTANYFFYRVVERSGWGWEHFGVRAEGAVGHLYARQTLDYEDENHRRGFKFMVQVTDRGRGGWEDTRHTDTAWVSVKLRDLNDNPPTFSRSHAHVTVQEDAAPGTVLAVLTAQDPDMDGQEGVEYRVESAWDSLNVNADGEVRLWRRLDREAPGGAEGVARIIGIDNGRPPLSATATLTITVTDVNDCPPRLLPPTVVHVTESSPPTRLATLTATDLDVWAMGHGPPFNISLARTNTAHVKSLIKVKFRQNLDSGRGGAEVWTTGSVDREEHRRLDVQVWLSDAGGMSTTEVLTVIVDDINDNLMRPASKNVYLCKPRGGGSDAPLGRVYVDDPDDWDVRDKMFEWVGAPHPLFTLNRNTGDIFASSQVREGRYQLQFTVSDRLWGQRGVSANVTVTVKLLTDDSLTHATPLTITPISPAMLTKGWTPMRGGGVLGRLVEGILRAVGEDAHVVEVVSVHDARRPPFPLDVPPNATSTFFQTPPPSFVSPATSSSDASARSACVWVSVREAMGGFIDPVKLQGLLQLHSAEVRRAEAKYFLCERLKGFIMGLVSMRLVVKERWN
ncbi:neural-cadherin-like [Penaeus indicus]|uniref:neural-cadherin-like n=1 Tax=Penaeus indicus TaxID=29960 RepID=UPI00300D915C